MAVYRETGGKKKQQQQQQPADTLLDDRTEMTLLGAALFFDDVPLLETLIDLGHDLDEACTVSGKTARQVARQRGDTDTAKIVLKKKGGGEVKKEKEKSGGGGGGGRRKMQWEF